MKSWKIIGQSIATGAGAALLASFASLFASSEAHAAKLIRENGETGRVTRIEGLSVFLEGVETIYDVDFLLGSAVDVYGEDLNFDFFDRDSAMSAASAVMAALGDMEYTQAPWEDKFLVGYGVGVLESGEEAVISWEDMSANRLRSDYLGELVRDKYDPRPMIAKFKHRTATTPEPNLIFGFITLGGLMLGSKRKNKG